MVKCLSISVCFCSVLTCIFLFPHMLTCTHLSVLRRWSLMFATSFNDGEKEAPFESSNFFPHKSPQINVFRVHLCVIYYVHNLLWLSLSPQVFFCFNQVAPAPNRSGSKRLFPPSFIPIGSERVSPILSSIFSSLIRGCLHVRVASYFMKCPKHVKYVHSKRVQLLINLEMPVLVQSLKSSNVELG